jgi:hypothetical protein
MLPAETFIRSSNLFHGTAKIKCQSNFQNVKVKKFHYRPGQTLRVPGV